MGGITEIATSAPGYSSVRPKDKAPIAETLRLNGYSTAQFGKCHEVPVWEVSPVGPFHQWPTGSGFEYFYGFIGGEANQYYPGLFEGTTPVEPEKTPKRATPSTRTWPTGPSPGCASRRHSRPTSRSSCTTRPAPPTPRTTCPRSGRTSTRASSTTAGMCCARRSLAKQKELGVVPADAELTARHAEIPAWDDMPAELKPVLAKQMEIYAGFFEQTDYEVGRLIDAIDDLGVLDDTLIYYILGDNGASAEGTPNGCFNEMCTLNGLAGIETTEFLLSKIDDFGTPDAYNHYAVGWAHALCAPYQWTKQIASHWGGTRNGTIVHWPNGITDKGETPQPVPPRHRCRADDPRSSRAARADNREQHPAGPDRGCQHAGTLRDGDAPETRDVQYFEMFGNRGIYHNGWTAVTKHRTPWLTDKPSLDDDVWELYGPDDWTQAHNLAAENPAKLAELQRLWLIEAVKYNVVPIDDRSVERFDADIAGRPTTARGRHPDALLGYAAAGELCGEHQEQVALSDRQHLGARRRRGRRHRQSGRRRRRLVSVRT